MAIPSFKSWLRHAQAMRKSQNAGFTLTELLISIIISALIVVGLLYLVVEILQIDARESARSETQRDTQLAMDYITSDLREAIYVYEDVSTIQPFLPEDLQGTDPATGLVPILAFWRLDPIETDELPDCDDVADDQLNECTTLRVRRAAYSLIVYLQTTETDDTWSGVSRILRYELNKYDDIATLDQSTGYVEPLSSQVNFQNWPNGLQGDAPVLSENPPAVLVDFMDAPDNADFADAGTPTASTGPICNTTDPDPDNDEVDPEYNRTSTDAESANSFFACVRTGGTGFNQDVLVYLRGNAAGRRGLSSDAEVYLPIETQVLVGGVVDKQPPSN